VAIGSELLLGQIVDSNSAWMAQRLAEVGADLFRKTTVGDNLERMVDVLGGALARADCVITGGGLGPTEDDLTRQAVAQVFGRPLERDAGALRDLEERFRARGFVLTPNNEKQALLPRGATLVPNPNGTAPAFIVEDQRGTVISLPGVPFEMKWLLEHEVVPYLRRRWGLNRVIHHRVLKVGELGESAVDHRIGAIMTESANPKVGVPFEMKWLLEHEVVPYLRRRWGLNRVIHHRVLKVGELGGAGRERGGSPHRRDHDGVGQSQGGGAGASGSGGRAHQCPRRLSGRGAGAHRADGGPGARRPGRPHLRCRRGDPGERGGGRPGAP
jgi:molybdenum cofactor synthesis domain-containing protein